MSKKNTTQNLNNDLSSETIVNSDEIINAENDADVIVDNTNVIELNIDDSTSTITETVVESEINNETTNDDVENISEEIITELDVNLVVDSNIPSETNVIKSNINESTSIIAETVIESNSIIRTIDSLSKDEYRQYQRTGRMPM